MPINGLTVETLASILSGNFNFIRPKPDRMRRRSKCSDELLSFAAKSELLPEGRFADRLRFNAAYLEMFTLSEVKHVVCRRSRWVTLLQVSHSELFIFSKPDQVALHLVLVR
jgi:hypothetical protein